MVVKEIEKCITYVLSILLDDIDFQNLDLKNIIFYEADKEINSDTPYIQIIPSLFFTKEIYATQKSLPKLPLKELNGIPILFGEPNVEKAGENLVVHADIIASAYFLLTRYEEMVRKDVKDEFDRFPGRESLPYRANFIDRPVVEEYSILLKKWLRDVGVEFQEKSRRFSLTLTHDIDNLNYYRYMKWQPFREIARALIGRQTFKNALECVSVKLKQKEDPYITVFDEMIVLDKKAEANSKGIPVKSIYFFMAGGNTKFDNFYDIHQKFVQDIIQKLHDAGIEIGLHASYEAGFHPEVIQDEKETLEKFCDFPVNCNRHHFLGWRNIEDGYILAKAGFQHDYTLGYADIAGFRLGVCHPIPLFDPINFQLFGIIEHPLIIMECTLSTPKYMNLNFDQALMYGRKLIDQVKQYNGELTLLFHNHVLSDVYGGYYKRLYTFLLSYILEEA